MDEVSIVTKKDDGSYDIDLNGNIVNLPAGSEMGKKKGIDVVGTDSTYITLDTYANEITLTKNGATDVILSGTEDDFDDRGAMIADIMNKFTEFGIPKRMKSWGSSRLNRKTRRPKRKGRSLKHRKLRKLTTRRR